MIFDFTTEKDTKSETITTARLITKSLKSLPDAFIICSTHHQKEFNTRNTHSLYTVYENEIYEKSWFSIGFWSYGRLWAYVNDKEWYQLSTLPSEFSLDWITICIELDITMSTLSSSIGGVTYDVAQNVTGLYRSPKFNLVLGIVDISNHYKRKYQFKGKISNINVFEAKNRNLTAIAQEPCNMTGLNSLPKWEDMQWNISGKNLDLIGDDNEICSYSHYVYLRLPLLWTQSKGKYSCQVTNNHSTISVKELPAGQPRILGA